jgi:hypothetical protein
MPRSERGKLIKQADKKRPRCKHGLKCADARTKSDGFSAGAPIVLGRFHAACCTGALNDSRRFVVRNIDL